MEKHKDIELRSEVVQEILTRIPSRLIRWGNMVILVTILLVLFLSYLVKYPDVISAPVVITTNNPPEKLIARTTGKIEKILVTDGQKVTENMPLAVVENSADFNHVFALKACVDSLNMEDVNFVFPFEKFVNMNFGDIQAAYTLFEKDYYAYDVARRLNPYVVELNAFQKEKDQLKIRSTLLQQQYELGVGELQIKKEALERDRKLFEKGIITLNDWESKKLDFIQMEKGQNNLSSQLSQIRSAMNEMEKGSSSSSLNEKRDFINFSRNTMQSLTQLKKAISDWELAYVLRSSFAGTVSFMQIWVENQNIAAGDQVFTIVPEDQKQYIAKLKAPVQNSGKIRIGQVVNIRLANFPDREFGVVNGRVKSISATPDKEGNLLIDAILPKGIETSSEKKIVFQYEMSGTADIITEDLRLIERFFYQFKDIFNR